MNINTVLKSGLLVTDAANLAKQATAAGAHRHQLCCQRGATGLEQPDRLD